MSVARLTPLEARELNALYKDGRFSQKAVSELRKKSSEKVGPPAEPVREAMGAVDVSDYQLRRGRQWCVHTAIGLRTQCCGSRAMAWRNIGVCVMLCSLHTSLAW